MRRTTAAALLLIALAVTASGRAQTLQIDREHKTIAISATDEASAIADLAAVTVGFDLYESSSDKAYAEAGKLSKAIVEALHAAGVDDKSIESRDQQLFRNTQFNDEETPEQRANRQFHFEQSWEVSTSPQNAATVIRAATAAGANQTGHIDWRLTERKALQAQAAANALIKARAQAAEMAEGLHVKLGALMYASNEVPETRLYFHSSGPGFGSGAGGGIAASMVVASPPLEIRPQTVREEATVYAVFSIE
jgi:uncharacterized protein YggE